VRERVAQFLAGKDRPTAFVTSNEVATLGAISAARSLSPAQFKAIGFVSRDGTNLFDYFEPPVSSSFYPLLDAGEYLAAALVKAVEGAAVATLQSVERTQFIERPHRTRGETM
jgi:LacI family transcriptional regulator